MELVEEDRVWRGWNRHVHGLRDCVQNMALELPVTSERIRWVTAADRRFDCAMAHLTVHVDHEPASRRL